MVRIRYLFFLATILAVALCIGCQHKKVSYEKAVLTYLKTNDLGYREFRNEKDWSEFIEIPGGSFTVGSNDGTGDEKPGHAVYLDTYYIGKYEVTNRQYKNFCNATGRSYPDDADFEGMSNYFTNYPDYPVVCVSWDDANAYCGWAGVRLPTEAEWEKAARGTDGRKFPWGNDEPGDGGFVRSNYADKNSDVSWSDKNIDDGYEGAAPVGNYREGRSPYGCYDMAGNVWEWCSDWYDENYYRRSPERNPRNLSAGVNRVFRGGSWFNDVGDLRCAHRDGTTPSSRYNNLGFRVASSL